MIERYLKTVHENTKTTQKMREKYNKHVFHNKLINVGMISLIVIGMTILFLLSVR